MTLSVETIEHFYLVCSQNLDKFLVLFTFLKLALLDGKVLIFASDVLQAYRIKLFLARFQIRSFVLSPELPKNSAGSLVHFFHIG